MTTIPETKQSPSIWRRLASALYDTFLVFGISCIIAIIALFLKVQFGSPIDKADVALNSTERLVLQLAVVFCIYLFFTHFWMSHGNTLGMQTWKMKIISDNNQPLTRKQASIRFLVAIVSYGFFGLGMLWCLVDKSKEHGKTLRQTRR